MSNITVENHYAGEFPAGPTTDQWTQMSIHAHQGALLWAMEQMGDAAATESAQPAAVRSWQPDGRYLVETALFTIVMTPSTALSVSASGSSVSRIQILYKPSGELLTWDGLITSAGLPMVSALTPGSRITGLTFSDDPGLQGVERVVVHFEGEVSQTTATGAFHGFSQEIRMAGTGIRHLTELAVDQPYLPAGGLMAGPITGARFSTYGPAQDLLRLGTFDGLAVRTDQVALFGLSTQGRAGNDSVTLTGSVGIAFDSLTGDDDLRGGAQADALFGNAGNDTLRGGGVANDSLDGGAGSDVAVFGGTRAQYQLAKTGALVLAADQVAGRDGTDNVVGIELLQFTDCTVDLTMGARAALIPAAALKTLEEMYVGFFGRIPEAQGLGHWIGQLAAGNTLAQVAGEFYQAGITFNLYSATMTDAQFIARIYDHVLDRPSDGPNPPGEDDIGYWAAWLQAAGHSRGTMVLQMLQDTHAFFENDPEFGFVADLLDNRAAVAHYYAVQQGLSLPTAAANIAFGTSVAERVTPDGIDAAIALIGVNAFSQVG